MTLIFHYIYIALLSYMPFYGYAQKIDNCRTSLLSSPLKTLPPRQLPANTITDNIEWKINPNTTDNIKEISPDKNGNWFNKVAYSLQKNHGYRIFLLTTKQTKNFYGKVFRGTIITDSTNGIPGPALLINIEGGSLAGTILHEVIHAIALPKLFKRTPLNILNGSGLEVFEERATYPISIALSEGAIRKELIQLLRYLIKEDQSQCASFIQTIHRLKDRSAPWSEINAVRFFSYEGQGIMQFNSLSFVVETNSASSFAIAWDRYRDDVRENDRYRRPPLELTDIIKNSLDMALSRVSRLSQLNLQILDKLEQIDRAMDRQESGDPEARELISIVRKYWGEEK